LLRWARDLGCNFVRLADYPHNENTLRSKVIDDPFLNVVDVNSTHEGGFAQLPFIK